MLKSILVRINKYYLKRKLLHTYFLYLKNPNCEPDRALEYAKRDILEFSEI